MPSFRYSDDNMKLFILHTARLPAKRKSENAAEQGVDNNDLHSSQFFSSPNLRREAVFLTMRPESLRLVISSSLHNTVPNWCQRFDL